jgi:hypothetical protein
MARGQAREPEQRVERLEGSAEAKSRMVAVLEALVGRRTLAQAALGLGISERRLRRLRTILLQAALTSMEPRPLGRPARRSSESGRSLAALESQVRSLRIDLRAAQVREEIALAMPHLLQRRHRSKKAARRKARRGMRAERSGACSASDHSVSHNRPKAAGGAALPASRVCGSGSGPSALRS